MVSRIFSINRNGEFVGACKRQYYNTFHRNWGGPGVVELEDLEAKNKDSLESSLKKYPTHG